MEVDYCNSTVEGIQDSKGII